MILGNNHTTVNRKKANFRGHYVSHERKVRGHLKKSRAKSPFLRDRENPVIGVGYGRGGVGNVGVE